MARLLEWKRQSPIVGIITEKKKKKEKKKVPLSPSLGLSFQLDLGLSGSSVVPGAFAPVVLSHPLVFSGTDPERGSGLIRLHFAADDVSIRLRWIAGASGAWN